MFLLAITHQSIARRVEAPVVEEFPRADWVVTVATDGWLSTRSAALDRVTVREAAPDGLDGPDFLFAEATISLAPAVVLDLHKTPIGGRHVYHHFGAGGDAYCASHIRLLRAAGVPIEEDEERLPEFFVYRYVTAPRTMYRRIDQLQSGQRLRFVLEGSTWREASSEGFDPPRARAAAASDGATTPSANGDVGPGGRYGPHGERAADALRDAMAALRPAVPPSRVLLSGGLDSSILFRLAQTELGAEESHSASYPFELEAEDVERKYALSAAEALGARHHLFVPTTAQFLRGFVEAAAEMEEPVVHLQSVLVFLMLRDGMPAERGAVVMGEGADGAFGMQLHANLWKLQPKLSRYRRLRPVLGLPPVLAVLSRASRWAGRGGDLIEVLTKRCDPEDPIDDPRHAVWRQHAVCDEDWARQRYRATVRDVIANRAAVLRPFQGRPVGDLISLQSFMADASLVQRQWSRLAESCGKWVYYPFHAKGVLDIAYSTPWDVKLAEPKGVLRGVARRVGVPEFIIHRPKANFSASAKHWALPGGVLEPLIPLAAKVWGEKELRRAQSLHMPSAYTFLAMLNYAVWKRLFIEGESLSALLEKLDRSAPAAGAHAGS